MLASSGVVHQTLVKVFVFNKIESNFVSSKTLTLRANSCPGYSVLKFHFLIQVPYTRAALFRPGELAVSTFQIQVPYTLNLSHTPVCSEILKGFMSGFALTLRPLLMEPVVTSSWPKDASILTTLQRYEDFLKYQSFIRKSLISPSKKE